MQLFGGHYERPDKYLSKARKTKMQGRKTALFSNFSTFQMLMQQPPHPSEKNVDMLNNWKKY